MWTSSVSVVTLHPENGAGLPDYYSCLFICEWRWLNFVQQKLKEEDGDKIKELTKILLKSFHSFSGRKAVDVRLRGRISWLLVVCSDGLEQHTAGVCSPGPQERSGQHQDSSDSWLVMRFEVKLASATLEPVLQLTSLFAALHFTLQLKSVVHFCDIHLGRCATATPLGHIQNCRSQFVNLTTRIILRPLK